MDKKKSASKEKEEYKKAQEIIKEAFKTVENAIKKEFDKDSTKDKAYY